MANYKLIISASAKKTLTKIPKKDIVKIIPAIESLLLNPFPSGIRKISGEQNVFRQRIGRYRIIYEVKNRQLIILILKIGHRRDIYKNLR